MSEEILKEQWVDEFAPKTIDDMVLTDELRNYFNNLIKSKTRFNVLLSGHAGIGKSTICNIIARELNASVLNIACSLDGTVSVAQGRLKSFCETLGMDDKPKVIILDELDSASGTQDNSFQKNLRNLVNDYKDCIWLANCNYVEKVIEPIRSRFGVTELKFSPRDLLKRLIFILDSKKIKYTKESLKKFVDGVMKKHYPDVRRIISLLQCLCSTGELIVNESNTNDTDSSFISELVKKCSEENDILSLRKFYITNKNKIDDYLVFSSNLFNHILDNGIVKDRDVILKMSNIIYQMNLVIDREVQFFSLITLINKSLKS